METTSKGDGAELSIRRLTVEDAEGAMELCGQLGYPVTCDELRRRVEKRAGLDDSIALAAFLDNQMMGWIEACVEEYLQSRRSAVIGGLVVRDGARGLGIGKRLCSAIEEWARRKAIPLLRVRSQIVREDAHRFYLREGYRKVKTSVVFEKLL